jgi:hypothetical protein
MYRALVNFRLDQTFWFLLLAILSPLLLLFYYAPRSQPWLSIQAILAGSLLLFMIFRWFVASKTGCMIMAWACNGIAVEAIWLNGVREYDVARRHGNCLIMSGNTQEQYSDIAKLFDRRILYPSGVILGVNDDIPRLISDTPCGFWLPLEPLARMQHVLTNDLPDFDAIDRLPTIDQRHVERIQQLMRMTNEDRQRAKQESKVQ